MPFNRWWPGKQRDISQSEEAGFISFSGDETVTVRVKKRGGFGKAVLRPVSKQIRPVVDREEIVFVLKENGNYALELDGEHHALHIFYVYR